MKFEWDFSELNRFATNLGTVSRFDEAMKQATRRLAITLHSMMKELTPTETGKLVAGWGGNQFLVIKKGQGFEVLIVNQDEKATWVNDGHRVRNRADGEYLQVKRRIKVVNPHQWQNPVSDWYVFGHFFVERGILKLNSTNEIERIIMNELQKWWNGL